MDVDDACAIALSFDDMDLDERGFDHDEAAAFQPVNHERGFDLD